MALLRHLNYRVSLHRQLTEHEDVQLVVRVVIVPWRSLFGASTEHSRHEVRLAYPLNLSI